MTPARRWSVAAASLVVLFAAAWLVLAVLVPSNDELARRLEAEFEARFGQKLVVGSLRWGLVGGAMVELHDVHTVQPEAIRIRRLSIHADLLPLLRLQWIIDRLELEGVVVPRDALAVFRGKARDQRSGTLLRHIVFDDVTYISYSGVPVVYAGDIRVDDDQVPHRVEIRRPDVEQPTSLEAVREGVTEGGADVFQLKLQAAGGAAQGQARLFTSSDGGMVLEGEVEPRRVEVEALLKAFNRRSPISGWASGKTALSAEGDTWTELFRSLHTRSELKVEDAKILRFNMEKAVKSGGKDRTGETPLESLTGVMDTRNTQHGMRTEFTRVKAVASPYTAYGRATLYRRQIDAEGKVELAGGLVEVPFSARGPTRQPDFEIAWGAIAGAVVGTAVLPGIGTVIGAKIGGAVSGPPKPPPSEPQAP